MGKTTDRYSEDHEIVVGGTLTVDGDLEVTGDVTVDGDLNVNTIVLSDPAIITTPNGDLDFLGTKEYRYHVPMAYIQQLLSGGYGSAVFTTPYVKENDTTTDNASTNYIGRTTFPLIRFSANNQTVIIPVHEIVKNGILNSLQISCETVSAEVFTQSPIVASWQKIDKAGADAMTSAIAAPVVQSYTFLNNTRRMLVIPMTAVTFDSETELLLVTVSRSYASINTMIVFSVELVVERSIYDLLN